MFTTEITNAWLNHGFSYERENMLISKGITKHAQQSDQLLSIIARTTRVLRLS